ncbi:NUDIX hydrolase [Bacteroidota bacterium]
MYKVFFKDRAVYFGDDFSRIFERNNGLFYKYNDNLHELADLIYLFHHLKLIKQLFIFHHDILNLFEEFKACFNFVEAAGGLVKKPDGSFLVIKRDGFWDLPKGKLDNGESFEDAARREVTEETGLSELLVVEPIVSTYHTYQVDENMYLKKTKWYDMTYTGSDEPTPQTEENITDIRWVAPGDTEFIKQNTYPSVMDVLYVKDLL